MSSLDAIFLSESQKMTWDAIFHTKNLGEEVYPRVASVQPLSFFIPPSLPFLKNIEMDVDSSAAPASSAASAPKPKNRKNPTWDMLIEPTRLDKLATALTPQQLLDWKSIKGSPSFFTLKLSDTWLGLIRQDLKDHEFEIKDKISKDSAMNWLSVQVGTLFAEHHDKLPLVHCKKIHFIKGNNLVELQSNTAQHMVIITLSERVCVIPDPLDATGGQSQTRITQAGTLNVLGSGRKTLALTNICPKVCKAEVLALVFEFYSKDDLKEALSTSVQFTPTDCSDGSVDAMVTRVNHLLNANTPLDFHSFQRCLIRDENDIVDRNAKAIEMFKKEFPDDRIMARSCACIAAMITATGTDPIPSLDTQKNRILEALKSPSGIFDLSHLLDVVPARFSCTKPQDSQRFALFLTTYFPNYVALLHEKKGSKTGYENLIKEWYPFAWPIIKAQPVAQQIKWCATLFTRISLALTDAQFIVDTRPADRAAFLNLRDRALVGICPEDEKKQQGVNVKGLENALRLVYLQTWSTLLTTSKKTEEKKKPKVNEKEEDAEDDFPMMMMVPPPEEEEDEPIKIPKKKKSAPKNEEPEAKKKSSNNKKLPKDNEEDVEEDEEEKLKKKSKRNDGKVGSEKRQPIKPPVAMEMEVEEEEGDDDIHQGSLNEFVVADTNKEEEEEEEQLLQAIPASPEKRKAPGAEPRPKVNASLSELAAAASVPELKLEFKFKATNYFHMSEEGRRLYWLENRHAQLRDLTTLMNHLDLPPGTRSRVHVLAFQEPLIQRDALGMQVMDFLEKQPFLLEMNYSNKLSKNLLKWNDEVVCGYRQAKNVPSLYRFAIFNSGIQPATEAIGRDTLGFHFLSLNNYNQCFANVVLLAYNEDEFPPESSEAHLIDRIEEQIKQIQNNQFLYRDVITLNK